MIQQEPMKEQTRLYLTATILLTSFVLLGGLSLFIGKGNVDDVSLSSVFLELRGLRLLAAVLIGSSLSVAGVMMQGLFRNPLAEPGVIGTNAGAMLGGSLSLIAYETLHPPIPAAVMLPLGCVCGGMLSLWIVLMVAHNSRDTVSVLLAGVIISMLLTSFGALLSAVVQEDWQLSRALVQFSLGRIDTKGLGHLVLAIPLWTGGIGAAWWWGRQLDVLLTGEDEARSLGLDLSALRFWLIIWSTLLVAGAVAIGGAISFVGLVVPHLLRGLVGAYHRRLVPFAALGGAFFVLLCDVVVRMLPTKSELPLGVITGLVGAPLFLSMLVRARREALL